MNKYKRAAIALSKMYAKKPSASHFDLYGTRIGCAYAVVMLCFLWIFQDKGSSWLTIISVIGLIVCIPIIIYSLIITGRANDVSINPRLMITEDSAREGYEFLDRYILRIIDHGTLVPRERADPEPRVLYRTEFSDDKRNNHAEAKTFATEIVKSILGIRKLERDWETESYGFVCWHGDICIELRAFL